MVRRPQARREKEKSQMSRRPNIQTTVEKKVERTIQADRQKRDRAMKAASKAKTTRLEPVVTCVGRGPVKGKIPPSVQKWISAESAEQLKHYYRISAESQEMAPLRDAWLKEFYARITGPRGFSIHAGTRRTIAKSEIPARPKRLWRVVW
jgi:hypothetical protein